MGRKANSRRKQAIIQLVQKNDGKLRVAGIAKLLALHPQEVTRALASLEAEAEKHFCEDDRGFLSVFRKWG